MQKENFTKILLIIFGGFILFGFIAGFLYSSLPEHNPQKNKQACESVGGNWSDDQKCLLSYKKEGDVCTDGGQCTSGICFAPTLTEEEKNNLIEGSLKNIVGTCYADNLATDCVEQVIRGTISEESMCL